MDIWERRIYTPALRGAFVTMLTGLGMRLAAAACLFPLAELKRSHRNLYIAQLIQKLAHVSVKIFESGGAAAILVLLTLVVHRDGSYCLERYHLSRLYQRIRTSYTPHVYDESAKSEDKPIRLIELLPEKHNGQLESLPRIKFRHTTLGSSTHVPYEALSYCWGDNKVLHPVLCGDFSVLWVTQNLHDALKAMRLEDKPRVLWADAICINQGNLSEKSFQVQQMADVYQNAERVLVWLGRAADNSETLETLVPQLLKVKEFASVRGLTSESDLKQLSREDLTNFGMIKTPSFDPFTDGAKPLLCIYRRDWWERIWIIQEFLLAKETIFCCGGWAFPWESLESAHEVASQIGMDDPSFLHSYIKSPSRQLAYVKSDLFDGRSNLMSLMSLTAKGKVTEPKDRVYALLSLAIGGNSILVDYSKSLEEVYEEATRQALTIQPHLTKLLTLTGITPGMNSTIPSWTMKRHDSFSSAMTLTGSLRSDASRGSEYELVFDGNKLKLMGFELDTIIVTGIPAPAIETISASFGFSLARLILACAQGAKLCNGLSEEMYDATGEPRIDAFWQTIMGESMFSTFDHQRQQFELFKPILQTMKAAISLPLPYRWLPCQAFAICVFCFLGIPQNTWMLLGRKKSPEVAELVRCYGRRISSTTKSLIGLVPREAEPGDRIFLLQGFDTPFVLRKSGKDSHYLIIGECYVHGHMDGKEWHEEKCREVWIV